MKTVGFFATLLLVAASSGLALAADPAPAKAPKISVEPAAFDFGEALQNKTLTKEFVVKNLGDAELQIERVTTTCGCTVAEGYSKTVKPGERTTLRVHLETRNNVGRVERKVVVKSNDPQQAMLEVGVSATIQAEAKAQKPAGSKQ